MSDEVYGERRRRREAERAEREAALREIQGVQGNVGAAAVPPSRREMRSAPVAGRDGSTPDPADAARGSRHETGSSVSQTLAPVSPIEPVKRPVRAAVPPSAVRPGTPSPTRATPPFRAPAQGPGAQGYPTAAPAQSGFPTVSTPTARVASQPPTVTRPGPAAVVYGSGRTPVPGAAPSASGAPRSRGAGTPPPVAPDARASRRAVPGASTGFPAQRGTASPGPSAPTAAVRAASPDPRGSTAAPQPWGDVIQGAAPTRPAGPAPSSPFGEPRVPPLSVFATPTTSGPRPSVPGGRTGAPVPAADSVSPPPIPTSGIIIPTVRGHAPTPAARPAVPGLPNWSATVDTGPPTGAPMLGGGTFAATVVKDPPLSPFADEDMPARSYTWLHLLVLVVVAFVLGMLVWLLINGGTAAVASGPAAIFVPGALWRADDRRWVVSWRARRGQRGAR